MLADQGLGGAGNGAESGLTLFNKGAQTLFLHQEDGLLALRPRQILVRASTVQADENLSLFDDIALGYADILHQTAVEMLDDLLKALRHHFARGARHFVDVGYSRPHQERRHRQADTHDGEAGQARVDGLFKPGRLREIAQLRFIGTVFFPEFFHHGDHHCSVRSLPSMKARGPTCGGTSRCMTTIVSAMFMKSSRCVTMMTVRLRR